jgi:hypothetical protein
MSGSHPGDETRRHGVVALRCECKIKKRKKSERLIPAPQMCHAVEVEHSGKDDASVVYIAATPTTPNNIRYIKSQLQDFLTGHPPEGFPSGMDETKLKGYLGEGGIVNGKAGRAAMGFGL